MSFLIRKNDTGIHRVERGGEGGGNNRICGEQRIVRGIILYFERKLRHPLEIISYWPEGDCMKRKWYPN